MLTEPEGTEIRQLILSFAKPDMYPTDNPEEWYRRVQVAYAFDEVWFNGLYADTTGNEAWSQRIEDWRRDNFDG